LKEKKRQKRNRTCSKRIKEVKFIKVKKEVVARTKERKSKKRNYKIIYLL
jgi:hypothetical protein